MLGKCANGLCSALHSKGDGKLFRLDIEIANAAGEAQLKTVYLWLCSSCARQMSPNVSVAGDRVLVRLALTRAKTTHDSLSIPRVN